MAIRVSICLAAGLALLACADDESGRDGGRSGDRGVVEDKGVVKDRGVAEDEGGKADGKSCSDWSGWTDLSSQYQYTCIWTCGGRYIRCNDSGISSSCWCTNSPGVLPVPDDSGFGGLELCSPGILPGIGACKSAFDGGCCHSR